MSDPVRAALADIRARMAKLHNEAATHEGGYAISTGALFDFIKEIDAALALDEDDGPREMEDIR